MTFSTIDHRWWRDQAVRDLTVWGAYAFVWSFTNSAQASLTGLTEVSERKLCEAWKIVGEGADLQLSVVLGELGEKPLVVYDHDSELLWCVPRVRFAVNGPKQAVGAKRVAQRIRDHHPDSLLLSMFFERYAELTP